MTYDQSFTLGDIINIGATILALIGLYFAYVQLKTGARTSRAEFVKSLVTDFYGNPAIYAAFYIIDCKTLDARKIINGINSEEMEKSIDSLLAYIDMVARLYKIQAITMVDARVLEYEIITCYNSEEMQKYLSYLDELYSKKNIEFKPHNYFRDFAKTLTARL